MSLTIGACGSEPSDKADGLPVREAASALDRIIDEHKDGYDSDRGTLDIDECPFGNIDDLLERADIDLGRGDGPLGGASLQRSETGPGWDIICAKAGDESFLLVSASPDASIDAAAARAEAPLNTIEVFDGELRFGNDGTGCGALWAPASETILVSLGLLDDAEPDGAVCRDALEAVLPTVVNNLADS